MLLKINEMGVKAPSLNQRVIYIHKEEAGIVEILWATARASKPNPAQADNPHIKQDMVWEFDDLTYQPVYISDLWVDPKDPTVSLEDNIDESDEKV
jgi:hypothetical protein